MSSGTPRLQTDPIRRRHAPGSSEEDLRLQVEERDAGRDRGTNVRRDGIVLGMASRRRISPWTTVNVVLLPGVDSIPRLLLICMASPTEFLSDPVQSVKLDTDHADHVVLPPNINSIPRIRLILHRVTN
uniref:Uncharacterized protein n=1 Tax=Setaria viridis TaxID=4556 RepID=A0A4V6D0W8_SETVI|nr:hypothetical protein SEVIR_9G153800v2 [Setaria viridis]